MSPSFQNPSRKALESSQTQAPAASVLLRTALQPGLAGSSREISAEISDEWPWPTSSSIPVKIEHTDSFDLSQLLPEASKPEHTDVLIPSPNGLPYLGEHVFPDDHWPLVTSWPTINENPLHGNSHCPPILDSNTSNPSIKIETRQPSPRPRRLTLRTLKSSTQQLSRGLKPEHNPRATNSTARQSAVRLVLRMPKAPPRLIVRIPGWRRHVAAIQQQMEGERA
jgi:hypothetical protein